VTGSRYTSEDYHHASFGTTPTILDLANSGADGDSPIDSTDSDLDAPAHKDMDRDADSDAARKARLSDS